MSSYKATHYKVYRCRYFDEKGRALDPCCNQGNSCRFVHPNDANWPGRPLASYPPRKPESSKEKRMSTRRSPAPIFNSTPSRRGRRTTPLAPQADVFMSQQLENEKRIEDKYHQYSDNRPRRNYYTKDVERRRERERSMSPPRRKSSVRGRDDTDLFSPFRKQSYTSSKKEGPLAEFSHRISTNPKSIEYESYSKSRSDCKERPDSHQVTTVSNDRTSPSSHKDSTPAHKEGRGVEKLEKKQHMQQIVGLFRDLSRLSAEANQLTEAQLREEQKMKTYTDISATLSSISASTATAVVPALAQLSLNHAQYKKRADETFNAIEGMWSAAFDIFLTNINHAIDTGVENALKAIRQEVGMEKGIERKTDRSLKRQRGHLDGSPSPADGYWICGPGLYAKHEVGAMQKTSEVPGDYKRRRLQEPLALKPSMKRVTENESPTNGERLLKEMKKKMDDQAHALEILEKQNDELKNMLRAKETRTKAARNTKDPSKDSEIHFDPLPVQTGSADESQKR